ncbi:MAG: DM13 domain-containing protein [Actinomycetota bacterium]
MSIRTAVARHPGRTAGVVVLGLALAGFGIWFFGPQFLFIDREVNEELPGGGTAQTVTSPAPVGEEPGKKDTAEPAGPVTLAKGRFRSLAHSGSGTALLVEVPDGRTFLRFEDLRVENGPDLKVYLSAAPADGDSDAHDDVYVELGPLKGNIGNQNYEVPNSVNVSRYESAVVWCKRFSVGFAAAPLDPV